MSNIPNVSAIYRDIAALSSTPLLPDQGQTSSYSSYSYPSMPQGNPIEQKYSHKQQRHNQLLNKFKNSYEEQQNLLGMNQSSGVSYSPNISSNYKTPQPYGHPSYNLNSHNNNYNNERISTTNKRNNNFVMPKIRYRHIEDQQKQKDNNLQEINPIIQTTLQRQFYEDHSPNKKVHYPTQIQAEQKQIRKDQDAESFNGNRTYSHGLARESLNAKYQQKIENYYELCKKNLTSVRGNQQREKPSTEKFIRSEKERPKKAMKLEEALKILSID